MAENLVRSLLISRIFNGFPIACFRLFIFIIFFIIEFGNQDTKNPGVVRRL